MNIFLDMSNSIGERLRKLREEVSKARGQKVTQRDVANLLGLNEHTYRSYEYDKAELPEDLARKLGKEFGKPWRWFYEDGEAVSIPLAPAPQLQAPVPYIGAVSAGSKFDWNDPFESEELIEIPPEMAGKGRFACTARGDSCFDLIYPEDTCVFQRHDMPKLGQVVIHRSQDRHVTIKQLKHDGREFFLHPLNDRYDDEPADGFILGYLIGIVREIGSRRVTVYDANGIRP